MARIPLNSALLDLARPPSEWREAKGASRPAIDWAGWVWVGSMLVAGLAFGAALVGWPVP